MSPPKKKTEQKINLSGLFEKGFEAKEFKNVIPGNCYKYLSHDKVELKYGETNRIYLENRNGDEVRLLVKGNTFVKLLEEHISVGQVIRILKNPKGYWVFDFCETIDE